MGYFAQPFRPGTQLDYGLVLYVMLRSIGFAAMTLLMTWGVMVLFFLAIGGFSFDGMMHQLANLSGRYIVADAARTGQFKLIVGTVHVVIAGIILFFRRHALVLRRSEHPEQPI